MRKYETLIVLRPELEEEERKNLIARFQTIIEKEGKVIKLDEWGMKKLAYEIEKLKDAYYLLFEYEAEATLPKEFERNLKINENVLRYMTTVKA